MLRKSETIAQRAGALSIKLRAEAVSATKKLSGEVKKLPGDRLSLTRIDALTRTIAKLSQDCIVLAEAKDELLPMSDYKALCNRVVKIVRPAEHAYKRERSWASALLHVEDKLGYLLHNHELKRTLAFECGKDSIDELKEVLTTLEKVQRVRSLLGLI